jgi:hypothetical protein
MLDVIACGLGWPLNLSGIRNMLISGAMEGDHGPGSG